MRLSILEYLFHPHCNMFHSISRSRYTLFGLEHLVLSMRATAKLKIVNEVSSEIATSSYLRSNLAISSLNQI